MLSQEDIIINKIAQDKITLDEGLKWFDELDIRKQRQLNSWLRVYLEQSHPEQELIDKAIEFVPLEPTQTSIAIFKTQPFRTATFKIGSLPDNKIRESFITLMTLFKHADTKRRNTFCKDGCSHEWHNLDR
jgi:Family of unknown function (DUF5958)